MNIVCEVCGDVGVKQLLLCCSDCKGALTHQYCLDKILYDASSVDWFCKECHQRHSEGSYIRSLGKVSSERLSSHIHFVTTSQQPIMLDHEASRLQERSMVAANGPQPFTPQNDTFDKAMSDLPNMSVLPKENNCLPSMYIENDSVKENHCGPSKLKISSEAIALEASATEVKISDDVENFGKDKLRKRRRLILDDDDEVDEEKAEDVVAANGPQPFTPQNDTFDKAMSDLPNMSVLPKENNCLPSMYIENDSVKENHCGPSKLKISSEAIALEASATEVKISDDVENFGKDKLRKRRRLILDDDDEVDEEKAEDVQKENVSPQPPKCDEPMPKRRVDTEYFVEETVRTGELNDQNLINGRPVKRRRRYIAENEDEEDFVGSDNVECALNDATNRSLNAGAKMVPQTLVATDHSQQSRPSHSEYDDQEYYIYSQPLDEPVWSGVFKIDTEVLMLDAHLSSKACERVRELSTSLQSVVEVKKLPRSQAWPKSWKSFGPTDDNIGLFFFPNSLRQNEVSNRLVNNIIKSDGALKVAVGMAELLIFPSSLLPEQYHFFQGNHYLWGVFRRRKDRADETVLGKEQDGLVKNAAEQGQRQEPSLLDQRDEALYESSDQETCAVKHIVHIENRLQIECDHEAEKEAVKAARREGTTTPGSSWSSAKMNSPKVGSNCCVEPRNDSKLDTHGNFDQQEDVTSLPANASSIIEQSSNSGAASVSTKLTKPVEHGHGQPHSGSEPSTRNVTARTPRSQQLIQEMVNEGALLFPVPEEVVVTTGSIAGVSTRVVSSETNPDNERLHPSEPPQALDFVSMGHCEPGADPEACLELFPVRQEHIGWTPRAEVSREVDLDLSLGKQSRAPSMPPLL